jgi:hypothetical protein
VVVSAMRWDEVKGHTIDAITFVVRWGSVIEDMAEMTAAGRAMNLGSHHTITVVCRGFDCAVDRIIEARPPRSTFEFEL